MKYKTLGNCPYCDTEINGGISMGWGGSQEMFDSYKKRHDENHPENISTPPYKTVSRVRH